MEGIRITKLQRDPEKGFWTARISNGDFTLPVHCQHGSWQTYPDQDGRFRDVLPPLAAELTAKMRREEKRERNGGDPAPQDIDALAETNPFIRKARERGQVAA